MRLLVLTMALLCALPAAFPHAGGLRAQAAELLDPVPRTALMSAYRPEWEDLHARLQHRRDHVVNGVTFATGTIEDEPVVLFLSGVSMVNAAMTAQLVLDRFAIERIVFSGIAGGVDPQSAIGDVIVPESWAQYLESVFAREVGQGYALTTYGERIVENFGMIFPQPVEIARAGGEIEKRFWFPVDEGLLATARRAAANVVLKGCTAEQKCLSHTPKIIVGGRGVSGQAFVDNAAFRTYTYKTFQASVLDMESAAVAHVAYANKVPYIAFRSVSDLAGGGNGGNEITTFFQLAADNSALAVVAFLKELN